MISRKKSRNDAICTDVLSLTTALARGTRYTISAPSTTSFLDSEWFPQELQSELSLEMYSLSESESATKHGKASAIVNLRASLP